MKFRRNKIKREHSIIEGALDWLEDLSKHRQISDIIPGVISVTNSKERGAAYQYETPTGCKILLKNGGSIQEAFVVTENTQVVKQWVAKLTEELDFFRSALDETCKQAITYKDTINGTDTRDLQKAQQKRPDKRKNPRTKTGDQTGNAHGEIPLSNKDRLLSGIKEEYELVEINQGLRDSLVDSLATMADHDDPRLEEIIDHDIRQALTELQDRLSMSPIRRNPKHSPQ
ncbi:DUF2103 domain-containing protein [Dehalobacter sp. DCM]|uniref:DUF2103 domain-containing protein n=1 Tax=Dehalobacter sp. DCM TaxID=2907827 RepID=UPI003081C575|nr:DUF2103 domain-containing protein [Dehalobacter sp. DCM]